mmetsp:Transcript_27021/g.86838  ORF Transcript_27021/g.86838 Transcript_27021/m.86838 type:complete len:626 (-) Transcript_27021:493-2370(-)
MMSGAAKIYPSSAEESHVPLFDRRSSGETSTAADGDQSTDESVAAMVGPGPGGDNIPSKPALKVTIPVDDAGDVGDEGDAGPAFSYKRMLSGTTGTTADQLGMLFDEIKWRELFASFTSTALFGRALSKKELKNIFACFTMASAVLVSLFIILTSFDLPSKLPVCTTHFPCEFFSAASFKYALRLYGMWWIRDLGLTYGWYVVMRDTTSVFPSPVSLRHLKAVAVVHGAMRMVLGVLVAATSVQCLDYSNHGVVFGLLTFKDPMVLVACCLYLDPSRNLNALKVSSPFIVLDVFIGTADINISLLKVLLYDVFGLKNPMVGKQIVANFPILLTLFEKMIQFVMDKLPWVNPKLDDITKQEIQDSVDLSLSVEGISRGMSHEMATQLSREVSSVSKELSRDFSREATGSLGLRSEQSNLSLASFSTPGPSSAGRSPGPPRTPRAPGGSFSNVKHKVSMRMETPTTARSKRRLADEEIQKMMVIPSDVLQMLAANLAALYDASKIGAVIALKGDTWAMIVLLVQSTVLDVASRVDAFPRILRQLRRLFRRKVASEEALMEKDEALYMGNRWDVVYRGCKNYVLYLPLVVMAIVLTSGYSPAGVASAVDAPSGTPLLPQFSLTGRCSL